MKRFSLLIIFSLLITSSPLATFADTTTFTLVSERVENGELVRGYKKNGNETASSSISIPKTFIKKIESSKEPVLETKKQLLTIYMLFDLKDKQNELDNVTLYNFGPHTLDIDFNYKMTFKEHQRIAYEYAKKELKKYKGLSKDTIIKELGINPDVAMSYLEIVNNSNVNKETLAIDLDEDFINEKTDTLNEKDVDKNKKNLFFKYILIFIILFIVFVLVYVVLKKK